MVLHRSPVSCCLYYVFKNCYDHNNLQQCGSSKRFFFLKKKDRKEERERKKRASTLPKCEQLFHSFVCNKKDNGVRPSSQVKSIFNKNMVGKEGFDKIKGRV